VHTDIVLTKLENQAKLEFLKKTSGLLAFIKVSTASFTNATDILLPSLGQHANEK